MYNVHCTLYSVFSYRFEDNHNNIDKYCSHLLKKDFIIIFLTAKKITGACLLKASASVDTPKTYKL